MEVVKKLPLTLIWATSSEKKMPPNMRNMRRFISACACAKCHTGLCSPFIQFVVPHSSVSGHRRPWSDCADAQVDLGLLCLYMRKTFSHGTANIGLILLDFLVLWVSWAYALHVNKIRLMHGWWAYVFNYEARTRLVKWELLLSIFCSVLHFQRCSIQIIVRQLYPWFSIYFRKNHIYSTL